MNTTPNGHEADDRRELADLLGRARAIQREQHTLIAARQNPGRFGQLERELATVWCRVDALRAKLGEA